MAEELKKRLSTQQQYITGTAVPKIAEPQHKPKQQPKPAPQKRPHTQPQPEAAPQKAPTHWFSSLLTLAGIGILAAAAFFLLTRSVTISQKQAQVNDLKAEIEALYSERDVAIATYNSSVDMTEIAVRASEYGMHAPTADQIRDLN